ncbi:MAG: type II toxin-antitoxin system ParD family antitoxin [bacterium]
MNVSLTHELERFVRDRVDTGRYHSASEVIREGLRLLESREQLRELQMDEIRKRLATGERPVDGTVGVGLRRVGR